VLLHGFQKTSGKELMEKLIHGCKEMFGILSKAKVGAKVVVHPKNAFEQKLGPLKILKMLL
jgi:uncharacterized protein YjgD (DUF1641 family)